MIMISQLSKLIIMLTLIYCWNFLKIKLRTTSLFFFFAFFFFFLMKVVFLVAISLTHIYHKSNPSLPPSAFLRTPHSTLPHYPLFFLTFLSLSLSDNLILLPLSLSLSLSLNLFQRIPIIPYTTLPHYLIIWYYCFPLSLFFLIIFLEGCCP